MKAILRQMTLTMAVFFFAVLTTNGADFTNFHNFSGSDGANVQGGLLLSGNTLYGTATHGGTGGNGAVFKVNTDGIGFTNFFNFSGSNGANAQAGVILSGNTLYGTTALGGSGGVGTVFRVNNDGSGFTNLYNFTATGFNGVYYTNSDGANPVASLVLFNNILYGTTINGGTGGSGTLFKVNNNGSGFTNFYNFTALDHSNLPYTNADGASPFSGLLLSGNVFYGTTYFGGSGGGGTLFKINTDGSGFANLHNFNGNDGANVYGVLALSSNILYGAAENGGSHGDGSLFALTLPLPILQIQLGGSTVILSWNDAGFLLQSAPAVTGVFTNVDGATSPYTNDINNAQEFFRVQAN